MLTKSVPSAGGPIAVAKLPTPNLHAGRDGHAILGVVIHCEEGTEAAADSWFASSESQVSAHYSVARDGTIRQFVDEDDSAQHAGIVDNPTAQLVLDHPGVNPNRYLVGVEHEGDGSVDLSLAQRGSSVALVTDICRRHGIPVDRAHILRHHEIRAAKTCPDAIDVDLLVAQVRWATMASAK
jgi:N-acetylmuramoyl-L-alanine amidase